MRNAEKITYIEDTGQVLYRSAMTHGKNRKNFELLPAEEFIARVTQHVPKKGFQMVRYYVAFKQVHGAAVQGGDAEAWGQAARKKDSVDFTILDVSDYDPPHVSLKTWRELIKKLWEVDPLTVYFEPDRNFLPINIFFGPPSWPSKPHNKHCFWS